MLTIQLKKEFLGMACELSPENLHCDGEISHAAAMRKKAAIMKRWKDAELRAGCSVSENETWGWHNEITDYDREVERKALESSPKDPRVIQHNSSIWLKKATIPESWGGHRTLFRVRYHDGVPEPVREGAFTWGRTPAEGYSVDFDLVNCLWPNAEKDKTFPTLVEAVDYGEAVLASITKEQIQAAFPKAAWRIEELCKELSL